MVFGKEFSKIEPLLTTGVVASILRITPDRLRMYDTEKLINTHRIQTGLVNKRLYSQYDVEWLQCIRMLIKTHKMSISSIKFLLQVIYKNPDIVFPDNKMGEIFCEMRKNPNFEPVVSNFFSD